MSSSGLVTNTRRLEFYIRSSVYFLLLLEPFVGLGGMPGIPLAITVSVAIVQTAANFAVCRWSLGAMRTSPFPLDPRTRILLGSWVAFSVAVVIAVVLAIRPVVEDPTSFTRYWLTLVVVLVGPICAIAALVAPRWLIMPCLAAIALGIAVLGLRIQLDAPTTVGIGLTLAFMVIFFSYSFWLSGWMLRVVWALEDARTTSAALAIAEERLRISRDLHDLFGRTLAAVAVKSELAAELIRRDRTEAAITEISAVRGLADESGREVREVIRGYRSADLGTELAGARALLESAGIRCVVEVPDLAAVSTEGQATLGWLLREAVTNVIRHSRATECVIRIDGHDPVRLVVTNNGTDPGDHDQPSGGSGLIGMRERVMADGGQLEATHVDGRFTLTATIPTRSNTEVAP